MHHCYLVGKGKVLGEGEPSEEGVAQKVPCASGWAAAGAAGTGTGVGPRRAETQRQRERPFLRWGKVERTENGENIRQWRKGIPRDLIWSGLYLHHRRE